MKEQDDKRSWAELVVAAVSDELVRQGCDFPETHGEGPEPDDFVRLLRGLDEKADDRIGHLCRQRLALQTRGTELVLENQRRHGLVVAVEELRGELALMTERNLVAERLLSALTRLRPMSDEEVSALCVLLGDHPAAVFDMARSNWCFKCDGCQNIWGGRLVGGLPRGRCPRCNSAFWIRASKPMRSAGTG